MKLVQESSGLLLPLLCRSVNDLYQLLVPFQSFHLDTETFRVIPQSLCVRHHLFPEPLLLSFDIFFGRPAPASSAKEREGVFLALAMTTQQVLRFSH